MKRFLLFILLGFLLTACEHIYSGRVVDKFMTGPAYKNNSPQPYIVFYCDSLKKNIAVNTTMNTYVNTKIGQMVAFRLLDADIK